MTVRMIARKMYVWRLAGTAGISKGEEGIENLILAGHCGDGLKAGFRRSAETQIHQPDEGGTGVVGGRFHDPDGVEHEFEKLLEGVRFHGGEQGVGALGFVESFGGIGAEFGTQVYGNDGVRITEFGKAIPEQRVRLGKGGDAARGKAVVNAGIHCGNGAVMQDASAIVVSADEQEGEDGPASAGAGAFFTDLAADEFTEPRPRGACEQDGPDDNVDYRG